jgi:hypothetical protein
VNDEYDFDSQPFIPTQTVETICGEIDYTLQFKEEFFESLLGDRGTGKTSSLVYFKNYIEKHSKKNNKKTLVVYVNEDFDKLFGNFFTINRLLTGSFLNIKNENEAEKNTKEEIEKYYSVYFLFDIPEDVSDLKEFKEFGKLLDFILRNHCGSIIISMNRNHYNKLCSVTNIVGVDAKITTRDVEKDFNENLMLKITLLRLKMFRENGYQDDNYFPFTIDALRLIANFSNNIPRNFLMACRTCLCEADKKDVNIIDENFVEKNLKITFATQIIESQVKDIGERRIYFVIYECLKNNFSSKCEDIQKLFTKLQEKETFPMSYPSLIHRIRKMNDWGILNTERNFKTPRGKSIEVIV